MIQSLSATQARDFLAAHENAILLDVREDDELAICQISGSLHIPMNLIPIRQSELADDVPIVVVCHHGVRSLNVARYLEHLGFEDLYNLSGGIDAWAREVEPEMARY